MMKELIKAVVDRIYFIFFVFNFYVVCLGLIYLSFLYNIQINYNI